MTNTRALILSASAIAAFTALSGFAHLGTPRNLSLSKESRLWFEGTSTVKSFKCTAPMIEVAVASESGASAANLVQSASFVVPVASIDCKNGTMNSHMQKALKSDKNPQIDWKMSSYSIEGTNVTMSGTLTIAGKTNPIEIVAVGSEDASGTVRVKGSKKFKMSEFGVKPPSLMLGTMKVGDPVTVSFDLVLTTS